MKGMKRKTSADAREKKKENTDTGEVWKTDGIPSDPLPTTSILLSRLGSATSREHLSKLINLVQTLVSHTIESIEEDDYRFETSLKMCGINYTNRAFQDLNHMIEYIRLGFHLDR
jgi:hypothetical protein